MRSQFYTDKHVSPGDEAMSIASGKGVIKIFKTLKRGETFLMTCVRDDLKVKA